MMRVAAPSELLARSVADEQALVRDRNLALQSGELTPAQLPYGVVMTLVNEMHDVALIGLDST